MKRVSTKSKLRRVVKNVDGQVGSFLDELAKLFVAQALNELNSVDFNQMDGNNAEFMVTSSIIHKKKSNASIT